MKATLKQLSDAMTPTAADSLATPLTGLRRLEALDAIEAHVRHYNTLRVEVGKDYGVPIADGKMSIAADNTVAISRLIEIDATLVDIPLEPLTDEQLAAGVLSPLDLRALAFLRTSSEAKSANG